MHTTQNTHHRIFVSNVKNQQLLDDLMDALGAEKADIPMAYDLIQTEGESTEVGDALFDCAMVRGLIQENPAGEFIPSHDVAAKYDELAKEFGIEPLSCILVLTRYLSPLCDLSTDIDNNELFDILNILGHGQFEVDGIYTQWAMYSDSLPYGANAGGTDLTTSWFCMPTPMLLPERAETVVRTLKKHTPENVGTYFFNEFINPLLDRVYSEEAILAISGAVTNFYWEQKKKTFAEPIDKGDVAGNEVQ